MGLFSWLFGKPAESKTEIPGYVQDASKDAIRRAGEVADRGYVPYLGAEVAAFNPTQYAAFRNNFDMAQDLGMRVPENPGWFGANAPQMTTTGGVRGYGSYGGFKEQQEALQREMPGLFDYIMSMQIDPVTGEPGSRTFAAYQQQAMAPQAMAPQAYGGGQYTGNQGTMAGRRMQEQAAARAGMPQAGPTDWGVLGDVAGDVWGGIKESDGLLGAVARAVSKPKGKK